MPDETPAPAASAPRGDDAALMRSALLGAGTFVWEWDLATDRLDDVDEGLEMLGYRPGEIGRTQRDWNRLIHPDDLAANEAAWLRHERGEADFYEHEYRIRKADGGWRWVRERGRVVERDAAGRALRALGTQTDITELRERDELARQAQDRLVALARHVPGALVQFRIDAQHRVTFPYASERCRTLFGLAPQALSREGRALL